MSKFSHVLWFMLTIGALGAGFWYGQSDRQQISDHKSVSDEPEILYWVAPMDDNYRRDKPGKSPMGMDLVPVYAEKEEKQPEILYWVAPMDDNYRRDKPGKSPMGMELVPVYADSGDTDDAEGTIKISPQLENSIGVRTQAVYVGGLSDEIEAVGTISLNQQTLFDVYSRVEGWVEHLYIDAVGDYVEPKQKLFSFYSPTLVHEQKEYLTLLKRGSKELQKGAETRLLALGISKKQIDQITDTGKVAEYVTVYARDAGFVTHLDLREGQNIRPDKKLITVADTRSVWVMVELFERHANDVALGHIGRLSVEALGERFWQARVKHIHPFLIEETRTLRLRLEVDNHDGQLKPGMFAKVRLKREIADEVIAVPTEALIRTGKQNRVVLALGDGKFRSVAVNIGREVEGLVQITKGLADDDKVVVSAQFLLDSESSSKADFSRMEVEDRGKVKGKSHMEHDGHSDHHNHHGGHH